MKFNDVSHYGRGGLLRSHEAGGGWSLVELLVVMSIISMLMGIMVPALARVRRNVRSILGANNQKQTVASVTMYAFDNDGLYPGSVATVGFGPAWNWSEPTKLTGNEKRSPGLHRALGEYLRSYIPQADVLFCPNAPKKYKYLQEAWDAGDEWDNPETPFPSDPVGGTYCFYWNYTGYLEGRDYPFRGPRAVSDYGRYSKLLVSDYFGYDHWRSRNTFASCEKFRSASVIRETWLLSAFWSCQRDSEDLDSLGISLRAGYTDGHVASFKPSEVVKMRVSLTSDGSVPYPVGVGPGYFYLPADGLR